MLKFLLCKSFFFGEGTLIRFHVTKYIVLKETHQVLFSETELNIHLRVYLRAWIYSCTQVHTLYETKYFELLLG